MKQKNSSATTNTPGMAISSERTQPRDPWPASVASAAAGSGAAVSRSAAGTDMADPRVEHTVGKVGEQVGEHHGDAEDEHDALDHRDVPVVDRVEQLEADAGQGEDLLND